MTKQTGRMTKQTGRMMTWTLTGKMTIQRLEHFTS